MFIPMLPRPKVRSPVSASRFWRTAAGNSEYSITPSFGPLRTKTPTCSSGASLRTAFAENFGSLGLVITDQRRVDHRDERVVDLEVEQVSGARLPEDGEDLGALHQHESAAVAVVQRHADLGSRLHDEPAPAVDQGKAGLQEEVHRPLGEREVAVILEEGSRRPVRLGARHDQERDLEVMPPIERHHLFRMEAEEGLLRHGPDGAEALGAREPECGAVASRGHEDGDFAAMTSPVSPWRAARRSRPRVGQRRIEPHSGLEILTRWLAVPFT